jgi:2-polyprenyl-3-methyl-5-hydroxy-6-metoxy-1,4-benzoquinol methylase
MRTYTKHKKKNLFIFCYNLARLNSEEKTMTAPITMAKNIIESLPTDTSYDEIIKELAFDRMIRKGLEDSKNGNTISSKEMELRIKQW